MRRFLCLIILALAAPASASAGAVFFVEGHGWGHGIGMAQWGAYGYAKNEGRNYEWILAHYYKGTKIAQSDVATVRILLGEGRKTVTIGSEGPFTVSDFKSKTVALPKGSITLGTGLKVKGKKLTSPLTFTRGARFLKLNGKQYRGKLVVYLRGGRLTVVNRVGIDDYIKGVVPDEMPPSWSPEALKAQAVAARSYAVATRKTSGIFDLYPDTRSQVYGGVSSEEPSTNTAISKTAQADPQVQGQRRDDVLPLDLGRKDRLRSRTSGTRPASPTSSRFPTSTTGCRRTTTGGRSATRRRALKRELGSSAPKGRVLDATVVRNAVLARRQRHAGRLRIELEHLRHRAPVGVRAAVELVLDLGALAHGRRDRQAGKRIALKGLARGVKDVWLQRRVNTDWVKVRNLKPGSDGRFTTKVRPGKSPSWFRIGRAEGRRRSRARHRQVMRRPAAVPRGAGGDRLSCRACRRRAGTALRPVSDGADAAQCSSPSRPQRAGGSSRISAPLDTLVFSVDDLGAASARAARLAGRSARSSGSGRRAGSPSRRTIP